MSQDWGLSQLLSLQQLGEGSSSTVLRVDLLDLDRVVTEEEVKRVEFVTAIVADVLPEDLEGEHASVVVEEALEATVGASTLQLNFNVVFELSLVGWNLFHVDHGASVREWVGRVVFSSADVDSLVGVVGASELVAVNNPEDAAVHVQIHAQSEIRPVVVARAVGLEEFRTLEEDALRNTRVGDARLNDVERVVIKVEVDDALPDPVVLRGVLNDWLEEVGFEVEDLDKGNGVSETVGRKNLICQIYRCC